MVLVTGQVIGHAAEAWLRASIVGQAQGAQHGQALAAKTSFSSITSI
jgi:hypothetical protein